MKKIVRIKADSEGVLSYNELVHATELAQQNLVDIIVVFEKREHERRFRDKANIAFPGINFSTISVPMT